MICPLRATRAFRAMLLTVAVVALPGAGRPLPAQQGMTLSPSERAEVSGYALSVDKVKRLVSMSAELSRLLAADPAFQALADGTANQSLTAQAALLEQVPKAASALRTAGLTAHDYAVGSRAFRSAQAIAQMQARGRPVPPAMQAMFPASVAQVAFVTTHQSELDVIAPAHRSRASRP